MEKILLVVFSSVLSGSFALAVVDKDFRDDFGRIAVAAMTSLPAVVKVERESKRENKRGEQS
ncbi:MAG: hypothetical protein KME64_00390 [Scytonematopsis contorta HA4267-MV1]|jgi:hypothetical protein|nr:hypothetical protein [Scytonematopsis contorta HA4267-MV1]